MARNKPKTPNKAQMSFQALVVSQKQQEQA